MLGAAGVLLSALNVANNNTTAAKQAISGRALAEAKLALLGYAATRAATDDYPGRLPCPEAAGYYGSAANEGIASGFCTLPAVGRLPWRTLGLSKLTDGYGEPLWYVVSPGFALPSSTASVSINSNTDAQLTLDGIGAAAVALIIAPGPSMNVQSATGCTARVQSHGASPPDLRDYLECENADLPANELFASTGPSTSFNDQVVRITKAELFDVVEPVVAKRIEREIVPALKTVYAPSTWGFSGTNPVYPFPALFANPGPGTGTSSFQGVAANYGGLLPFNQTQGCTPSASDPRCTTTFLAFSKSGNDTKTGGTGSIRTQSTCSWQSNVYVCTGEYNQPSISLTFKLKVTKVAMGLRALDPSKVTCTAVDNIGSGLPTQNVGCSAVTAALQSDGSAIVTITTNALPYIFSSGWGTYADYTIKIDRAAIGDHALLNSSDSTTGWFVRNEWYRLAYYAVAQGHTAASLPAPACTTLSTCLSVTNVTPAGAQRAILIFAGRALGAQARPSDNAVNYFEDPENYNGDRTYVKPTISKVANDRVVVIDANP